MINSDSLVAIIVGCKQYFPEHWTDEKYDGRESNQCKNTRFKH